MIAPAELARLTQSSTPHALLDLREKAAYERGHIYRATSLPRRLLEFRLPTLVPARATPLVLCDADARGVCAGLSPRLLERPGRRAGPPHRRAGQAPRDDDRRSLRRPHALLHRRRVAPAHAAAQPRAGTRERDDGLGARGAHARARRGALGAGAVRPEPRGRHADGEARRGRGWSGLHLAR